DIIVAFEDWGPGGESGAYRGSAAADMIKFVQAIAAHARATHPGFGIFVQNGEALGANAGYLATVDGIGREDTFYDGNTPNDSGDVRQTIADLDRFKKAGKKVLIIDYVRKAKLIDTFYAK